MINSKSKVAAILLAGGFGKRMNASMPKQYLLLNDKPIACYSLDVLSSLPEISQIVVVCDPEKTRYFTPPCSNVKISFAAPGEKRQDSLYQGLQMCSEDADLVLVHDAARPLISKELVQSVIKAAEEHGAAAPGMPVKCTIKEIGGTSFVAKTPNRSLLFEVQTPQVIRKDWLAQGFLYAKQHNLHVTDDVSLVELLGHPVKLVEGSSKNIKITTPEDLKVAELFLKSYEEARI